MGERKKRVPEETGIQKVIEESRREFLKKVGISGAAFMAGAAAVFTSSIECYTNNQGTLPPGVHLFW